MPNLYYKMATFYLDTVKKPAVSKVVERMEESTKTHCLSVSSFHGNS